MSRINMEDIIMWQSNNGKTLCPECFEKKFESEYPIEWTPIISNGEFEILYECDDCGERSAN
ncbi:MAG: hypothetical protein UR22_C0009G0051 [Parcubacteria group bacterium GW2011_GWC2_32_10]|nr:MAG: hypothetical protein UR22_C0009G0051 [Parcubacteria group bacterium GW2011_GWC2_32_10]